jgi:hypothetical protein
MAAYEIALNLLKVRKYAQFASASLEAGNKPMSTKVLIHANRPF